MTPPPPDQPLRVPAVTPARWVYLRAWSYTTTDGVRRGERTVGSHGAVVVANEHGGWICPPGLAVWVFTSKGSFEANQREVDLHLMGLGAEVVPEGEWPVDGVGFGPREVDRTPWRIEDSMCAELKENP